MKKWINNNGEYYDGGSIVIGDRRYLSPSDKILREAGYHEVLPPEPTADELLAAAKSVKVAEIEEYDTSSAVNEFLLGGVPMWLDAHTRQQLRVSIEAYQATGAESVTKWFDGQEFTFPTSAWLTMLNALEVYAAEALNVTEAHKAHIMSLSTADEVTIYDFTIGYPQKLNFSTEWMRSRS